MCENDKLNAVVFLATAGVSGLMNIVSAGFFLLGTFANLSGLVELFLGVQIWPADPALWALACFGAFFAFAAVAQKIWELRPKPK